MSLANDNHETAVAVRMQDLSPEYAEIMILGKVLQASGYFSDVRDQAQAVTKILCGRELGFSPIISMQGIHIIEGKPALSSNLMATLIKRSGKYDYRVKQWNNDGCVLMFREKIDGKWEEVGESSFSIEDAKRAKVKFEGARGPSGWAKFPKAMCFARAISQGLRTYCPDVSAAPIYNPEEMGAEVNEEGEVTDLPKSAKSAETVTEAKVFQRKATPEPEPIPVSTSGPAQSGGDGEPARGIVTPLPQAATIEDVKAALVESQATPAAKSKYVLPGQAANFHREMRAATREERMKEADVLTYQWLADHGYVDKDKMPSASMLPGDSKTFQKVRAEAIAWIQQQ